MQKFGFILLIFIFCSCGSTPEVHNSVDTPGTVAKSETSDYVTVARNCQQMPLPALITTDIMLKLTGAAIDNKAGYALLPGDFDPASYKSVTCVGHSLINSESEALWFCLKSPGDYEESPDNVDIMIVLYDKAGKPIDACNVAYSSLGYSYSYVRQDSLFTVEVDEMENINISTYGVAIGDGGFMPEEAATKTFQPDEAGKKNSELFREQFINNHKH